MVDSDYSEGVRTRRLKRKAKESKAKASNKKNKPAQRVAHLKPKQAAEPSLKGRRLRNSRSEPQKAVADSSVEKDRNSTSADDDSNLREAKLLKIMRENNVTREVAMSIEVLVTNSKDNVAGGTAKDKHYAHVPLSNSSGIGRNRRGSGYQQSDGAGGKDILEHNGDEDVAFDLNEEEDPEGSDDNAEEDVDFNEEVSKSYKDLEDSDEELDVNVPANPEIDGTCHQTDELGSRNSTVVDVRRPEPELIPTGRGHQINIDAGAIQRGGSLPSAYSTFDESVIAHMLDAVKRCVTENMKEAVADIVLKLQKDLEDVIKLRDYVSDLTNVVTASASAIFIKQPTAAPRTKEIHNKLCILPALFNDSFMLRMLSRCILGHVYKQDRLETSIYHLGQSGLQLLSMLFFSRQPNEKAKEKFSSDIGRCFSKFRNGVMLSSFLAMQNNKFGTFVQGSTNSTHGKGTNHLEGGQSEMALHRISQPFWLKPGYIRTDHCLLAASKFEKNNLTDGDNQSMADSNCTETNNSAAYNGKGKVTRTGPICRDEIALEASSLLYKIITSVLHRSRQTSKMELFQSLLYLFCSWSQYDAPVSQETMQLNWEESSHPNPKFMDNLPVTKMPQLERGLRLNAIDVQKMDLDNLKLLEGLITDHPELSLLVEHDVLVEGTVRTLKYRISMLEVASKFFASFISNEMHAKVKDALSSDKNVLKLVFVLAYGLRALIDKPIQDLVSQNCVPWANTIAVKKRRGRPKKRSISEVTGTSSDTTQYAFQETSGLNIQLLQPAPSKQRDLLAQMILRLSEEEYTNRTHHEVPAVERVDEPDTTRLDLNVIQPDANLGIFDF